MKLEDSHYPLQHFWNEMAKLYKANGNCKRSHECKPAILTKIAS